MRSNATFRIVDGRAEIETEDGMVYPQEMIGYVAPDPGSFHDPSRYKRFTREFVSFIQHNSCEVEVVMDDEFTNPDEFSDVGLFEGDPRPKLFRGKLVIHIKPQ